MEQLLRDLRFALRSMRQRRAFTAAIVLTIAIGIGASTAIFSLVNAALLRPFPFEAPESLVFLWGVAGPERDIRGASPPEIADWRAMSRTLDPVSLYDETTLTLQTSDGAVRVEAEMVSGNYFELLGVGAARGRTFLPEDDRTPDARPVAVIGHELWTTHFGADPAIVGGTITLNERPFTVIGVMPPHFEGLSFDTQLWIPSMMISATSSVQRLTERGTRWLGAVARLRDGVTVPAAQRDMDVVAERLARAYPDVNTGRGVQLMALPEFYLGDTRELLLIVLGAVGLFLLIACANVTGLQLVRATSRQREIAVRLAIGASRRRLIQQLMTEGMVLAVLGAALGLLLASWSIDALIPFVPDGLLPRYVDVTIDGRVLAFSAAIAAGCGLLFGLAPAIRSSRVDLSQSLKEGTRAGTDGTLRLRRPGLQQLLVIAEVALAMILLTGTGLLLRSFAHRLAVEPGFEPANVLVARFDLARERYDAPARAAFVEQLIEQLEEQPGIEAVTVGSDLPLTDNWSASILQVDGGPEDGVRYYRHHVSPNYFATLGIPILRGRAFTAEDRRDGPPVAVVSHAMTQRFWPGEDAIGKTFRVRADDAPVTIVGVIPNARFRDLTGNLMAAGAEPDVFFALSQWTSASFEIAVRTRGDPSTAAPVLRRTLSTMDPALPVYAIQPMTQLLRQQTASSRFGSLIMSSFSAIALLLAAVGIYGIMAFAVGRSAHEIALRIALGAAARSVVVLIMRQGMLLVVAGVAVGLAGAALATRLLDNQLFGVAETDPATFGMVAALLLAVALLASWIPARRAARIDPQTVLKAE